jgi:4-amino-4-deoxy-L-arabinose transferase-like glycosyltransferase
VKMAPPLKRRGSGTRHGRISDFGLALAALTLIAFAIRLIYALAVAPAQIQPGDPRAYHHLADALANGRGYNLEHLLHRDAPTAAHPPLYPLYLAGFWKLGLGSFTAHRAVSCLLGAAAVALIGLLGRRLAGPRVGLLAAGLAVIYPQLFFVDGTLVAESLYAPLIVLTLLLAYRLLGQPSVAVAAALGGVIGLATLTRSDGILLFPLLAVPVAWRTGRGRLRLIALVAATTALVLSPWLVRNWVRFDRFPLLSSNGALTQAATNCPKTYYGRYLGFVAHDCALRSPCLRIRQEIPQSECLLRKARAYVADHRSRVPVVTLARAGRMWNVYAPGLDLSYGQIWARERNTAKVGMAMYFLFVPLGFYGAVLLRRRHVPLLPLLATFLLATLVAMIAFGFSRYRLAAEPALVVLAAVALEWLAARAGRLPAEVRRPIRRSTLLPRR